MVEPNPLQITARADIGGGPEHVFQLVSSLSDRCGVAIASPQDEPYWKRFVAVAGADSAVAIPHRKLSIAAFAHLVRFVRQRKINLIHSHGKGAGLYGRALAAMTGLPCVHTFHGFHVGEYGALAKKAYVVLEKGLGLFTRAAICVSQGEFDLISEAGLVARSKLVIIENGVQTTQHPRRETDAGPLKIVAVSRFDFQKNTELMIDIAGELGRREPNIDFELTIYGGGDDFGRCKALVEERGLSGRVTLPGTTTSMRQKLRESHVFLSTSRWEGMPLAVLEAMSEGLPVVASAVVGNIDVVEHGTTGFHFRSEDAKDAAGMIETLRDPKIRQQFGTAARASVDARFSVDRMADRVFELYCDVLTVQGRPVGAAKERHP